MKTPKKIRKFEKFKELLLYRLAKANKIQVRRISLAMLVPAPKLEKIGCEVEVSYRGMGSK